MVLKFWQMLLKNFALLIRTLYKVIHTGHSESKFPFCVLCCQFTWHRSVLLVLRDIAHLQVGRVGVKVSSCLRACLDDCPQSNRQGRFVLFFFFFLSDGGITRRYTYVSFYIKIFFTDAKYISLCKINLSTLHFEVFV